MNERPKCLLCGKTFKDRRGLSGHMRIVHDYVKDSVEKSAMERIRELTSGLSEVRQKISDLERAKSGHLGGVGVDKIKEAAKRVESKVIEELKALEQDGEVSGEIAGDVDKGFKVIISVIERDMEIREEAAKLHEKDTSFLGFFEEDQALKQLKSTVKALEVSLLNELVSIQE